MNAAVICKSNKIPFKTAKGNPLQKRKQLSTIAPSVLVNVNYTFQTFDDSFLSFSH